MSRKTNDRLLFALFRAVIPGSNATQQKRRLICAAFVTILRNLGCGVREWRNVTNKHCANVINEWKAAGLSAGTIKSYMAHVRKICQWHGNNTISKSNEYFEISKRTYVDNVDRSLPQTIYERVSDTLLASSDPMHWRLAAQMKVMRELGLRPEEARKLSDYCLLPDGRLLVTAGAKGGRERMLPVLSEKQLEAFQGLMKFLTHRGTTIPSGWSEVRYEKWTYRTVRELGMSRAKSASFHGLRHARFQEMYREMCGWDARVKYPSYEAFVDAAEKVAGPDWKRIDKSARAMIMSVAGHGTGRDDVVGIYIGSRSR